MASQITGNSDALFVLTKLKISEGPHNRLYEWNRQVTGQSGSVMQQALSCQDVIIMLIRRYIIYREISTISRTKYQTLNVSRLVPQLSLSNPLKPGNKSKMKM